MRRLFIALLGLAACVPDGAPRSNETPPVDTPVTRDAGTRVETPRDGGTKRPTEPRDAGLAVDAGVEPDAGFVMDAAVPRDAGPMPDPPPHTPMLRIETRIHVGESELSESEQLAVFAEMQRIWWHAGVCFEIETVSHDDTRQGGFDLWFVPIIRNPSGVNGVYFNDHRILTRDVPRLREVPTGTNLPAARTGAHELGHGLNLGHRQNDTNLMASGTTGWTLNDAEIRTARARAEQKALADTTPISCGPPVLDAN